MSDRPWVVLLADADGAWIELPMLAETFRFDTVEDALAALTGGPDVDIYVDPRDDRVAGALHARSPA